MSGTKTGEASFSPEALRAKYRLEREKRLRPDGNAQYRDLSGLYADFDEDPYVEPGFTRAPLTDEVEVVVIGGGFGGQLAAARLKEAGVPTLAVIDHHDPQSVLDPLFADVRPVSLVEDSITLAVPSPLVRERLQHNHLPLIERAAQEAAGTSGHPHVCHTNHPMG